jgi:UDP:flavonoid glycosyltransferase YjiC (YdhE family)
MARLSYDVVIVSDLRLAGPTGRAIGEQIRAQAAAGYRTGLIHIRSALLERPHPFHPLVREAIDRGLADWLDPEVPVSAGVALAHNPAAFAYLADRLPRIQAQWRILVVNHPLLDGDRQPFFDGAKVAWSVQEVLGGDVMLAPSGPPIRAQFQEAVWPLPLLREDWPPVLDPDAFGRNGRDRLHNPTVVGRHGGADPLAWPEDHDELRSAYPHGPEIAVRVLGCAKQLRALLGDAVVAPWAVLEQSRVSTAEFLAQIDAFVGFAAKRVVQPVRLETVEAMACGAPAILPEDTRPVFGDAAIYTEPTGVRGSLAMLRAEPRLLREHKELGREVVQRSFSHAAHVGRLRRLIGPPVGRQQLVLRRERRPKRRVLFFSSNGVGMGHLTRLLAIARRCPARVEPVFLSMSPATRIAQDFGYLVEFTAYHAYLDLEVERWNAALRTQLDEMIAFFDVRAVLFDGNAPYRGLVDARLDHPSLPFLWCRRGLWRPGTGRAGLERERQFDAVIEPREVARQYDRGATAYYASRTQVVDPILLLDREELLARDAARAELGLDLDRPALLIQLGSRNNYDYGELFGIAIEHAARRGVQLAVSEWLISDRAAEIPAHVVHLRSFPLSRCYNAFDGAITAVGYNSFHELIAYGLPAIFVPNEHPSMDDQLMRALFAERRGFGLCVRTSTPYRLRDAIDRLLDSEERAEMASRCRALAWRNGAADVARLLEETVFGLQASRPQPWEAQLVRRG